MDNETRRPPDTIITPEWVEKLLAVPFVPSKYNHIIPVFGMGIIFSDFGVPLENKKGKGVLMHKAKAPVKPPVGKLSTRKKRPVYTLQQYEVVAKPTPMTNKNLLNEVIGRPKMTTPRPPVFQPQRS